MARLVSWPVGLRPNSMRPLAGPRTIGAGSSETLSGFTQTVASPFGGVTMEFGFPPLRGQAARRARGWITTQHGGANATRVPVCDWDGLSLSQRGISATQREWAAGQPWDFFGTGLLWDNGEPWLGGSPVVPVAATSALGATTISLANAYWGLNLDVGDWIGFFPFHFGRYEITEVFSPGVYRIDLPLRKTITTANYATLNPIIAMRLMGENAAQAERGPAFLDGLKVQLTEVRDYDVNDYFAD